jgi:8-oxo-dGTP pyrophosphatase MutT (NUDIX family)
MAEFHTGKVVEHILPDSLGLPWHFTASAVVILSGHILLVHHKRIGAWLPPGGHIDEPELPHRAAVRETLEETGVLVKVLTEPLPKTDTADAFVLPQPLCIHAVKAVEKGNELFHVDIAYLCAPVDSPKNSRLPPLTQVDEVYGSRWLALSALDEVPLAKNVPEIVALAASRLERMHAFISPSP